MSSATQSGRLRIRTAALIGTDGLALLGNAPAGFAATATATGHAIPRVTGQIINISGMRWPDAEVEAATASSFIYQVWIGFARSTDSGATYSSAVELPGSGGGWDPAIAVGPTGIVYAAYMLNAGGY
jgi:hypothetical protein